MADALDTDALLRHAGFVRAVARSLLRDEGLVDDVVQETWLAALRRPPRPANVRGWLGTVARNLALRRRRAEGRRARREHGAPLPAAASDPADVQARLEVQRAVVAAVAALPEPYRSTVVLRYYDGLAAAEIARRHGVPDTTVRTRLRRARARIRDDLDERHGRRAWCLLLLPLFAARPRGATVPVAAALILTAAAFGGVRGRDRGVAGTRVVPREAVRVASVAPSPRAAAPYARPPAAPTGAYSVRIERPGWEPRVVTGTLHLAGDRSWLALYELSHCAALPVRLADTAPGALAARAAHPSIDMRFEARRSGAGWRGRARFDAHSFAWTATPRPSATPVLDALVHACDGADTDGLHVTARGRVVTRAPDRPLPAGRALTSALRAVAAAVAAESGRPQAPLHATLFAPLSLPERRGPDGLEVTAADLARMSAALAGDGLLDGRRVFPRGVAARLLRAPDTPFDRLRAYAGVEVIQTPESLARFEASGFAAWRALAPLTGARFADANAYFERALPLVDRAGAWGLHWRRTANVAPFESAAPPVGLHVADADGRHWFVAPSRGLVVVRLRRPDAEPAGVERRLRTRCGVLRGFVRRLLEES